MRGASASETAAEIGAGATGLELDVTSAASIDTRISALIGVKPGHTQLARMPAFAPSSARHFVSMTTPALEAQYAASAGIASHPTRRRG